jgi:AcrR family transcriptional regulator
MLKAKDSNDTRGRILEVAFDLFGRYGVEGTSIRKIAEESNVNLAAVNYHFESKDNLYWEIMKATFTQVDQDIAEMSNRSKDIYELSDLVFDYFMKEKIALKNTMKMLMMEGIALPSAEMQAALDDPMGPPGGGYFAAHIEKSVDFKLNREGVLWGVKAIFGSIMHWTVMMASDHICASSKQDELMTLEQIKKDVMSMTKASLLFIKSNTEFKL